MYILIYIYSLYIWKGKHQTYIYFCEDKPCYLIRKKSAQIIRAHRVLLSAGSSYLERVLSVTTSDHPTVVLSGIRYKELKLLVDFMYSGEVAVAQTQFPGLMEAANWLGIRGLCTEEEKEEEEEEESKEEVTVTTNERRKRQLQGEESEEEEEEQILGPEEEEGDQVDVSPTPGKQMKHQHTYGAIKGVNNAVWMMKPEEKKEDGRMVTEEEKEKCEESVPDLVRMAGPPVTAPPPNLTPNALNEQLLQVRSTFFGLELVSHDFLQAMQLCTNPYLNPLAALQQKSRTNPDLTSPTNSPFKASSSTSPTSSPLKSSLLVSSAPVRRYKQYSEDSLQAALREIMAGQSINRSSMKHAIPARTLRDWMKRLNITSVFTHAHRNGKSERGGSQGVEEESLASNSPEPLLSPTNLRMIQAGFNSSQMEEEEEDSAASKVVEREENGIRMEVNPLQQIAQTAN